MNSTFPVPQVTALAAISVLAVTSVRAESGDKSDPLIPVGWLSAYPTIVHTGTKPELTWSIQYPEGVHEIVIIEEDGSVTPKTDLCMEVRVLGASYQIGTSRGKPVWGTVRAELSANGSSFVGFFENTQDKVKPSKVYHSQAVSTGQPIDFRARCHDGRQWKDWRSTTSQTPNVVALTDGQTPPSTVPAFNQGNIEDFLEPYLDAGGNINIGPKDVIFLIELGQTNPQAAGFDLQDIVLLATFDYCKNNNGHGNNVDGVDSSNPGNAPFEDSDPTVDDEGKGGGAYPSQP